MNSQAKFLIAPENGNKLYTLLQDNMICIVPDISQYNMPKLEKGKKVNGMPPGFTQPYKIIPEKTP